MRKLLKCGDHKYAPAGILCVHLAYGISSEWVPVSDFYELADRTEVENDWLCPECAAKWPQLELDEIVSVCIHCIRELRQKHIHDDRHSSMD